MTERTKTPWRVEIQDRFYKKDRRTVGRESAAHPAISIRLFMAFEPLLFFAQVNKLRHKGGLTIITYIYSKFFTEN